MSESVPEVREPKVNRSEQINELVSALCKAQLCFTAVLKDAENPAYSRGERKSMYATLDSVIAATRKSLAENGLAIIALPHEISESNRLSITSMLTHTSGQFIESTLTMAAVDRVTPQEIGKLITYARRYQWTSLTGTAPEDDDDANNSSGVGSKAAAQSVATSKLKKAADGDESVSIVPYKEGFLALTGNGLAIVRAGLTEGEKTQLDVKFDKEGKVYVIREAEGNMFASLAERCKVPVKWIEASA